MSKHTKGPWVVDEMTSISPADDLSLEIASVQNIDNVSGKWMLLEESQANARLIAAAPELYDELVQADAQMQMAYECVESGRYNEALLHLGALSRTRSAAIAKARGEA